MHRRFISVPVNSAGIEEYDYGVDESENYTTRASGKV